MMGGIAGRLNFEVQMCPICIGGCQFIKAQAVPIPPWTVAKDQLDPTVGYTINARLISRVEPDVEADIGVERLGIYIAAEGERNNRLAVTGWPAGKIVHYLHRAGACCATTSIRCVKGTQGPAGPVLRIPSGRIG